MARRHTRQMWAPAPTSRAPAARDWPHGVPCRHRRRWLVLPKFEPLLTDSRTGVSVPECYAAFTSDCQGRPQ